MTDDTEAKPVSIKGIPGSVWREFTAAAGREKLTMGEFVVRAGQAYILASRQEAQRRFSQSGEIIDAELEPAAAVPPSQPWRAAPADRAGLREALEAMQLVRELTGEKLPGSIVRQVHSLLRRQLRALTDATRQPRPAPLLGSRAELGLPPVDSLSP